MLKSLAIKDYALIESIEVEFENGLNIITGETGAGKSILIDALGILLGDRASIEVVRRDCNKAIIEGIFDVSNNKKIEKFLIENEIDFNDELILRREISIKGNSRVFINDSPVNLNLIKEAGDYLVDLHGQHEHQSLLRSEKHVDFLDDYLNIGNLLDEYRLELNQLSGIKKELKSLYEKERLIKEKFELYSFQLKEINEVSPSIEEEEVLEKELKILENSAKLTSLNQEIYSILYEGENPVYDQLINVINRLKDLSVIDEQFKEKESECNSATTLVQDVAEFVRSYMNKIESDPARLEEVRERIVGFNRLKKKYGGSIKSVLDHKQKISEEIDIAANFDEKIKELNENLKSSRLKVGFMAKKISDQRKKGSIKLKSEIEESLKYLGINHSEFLVSINNKEAFDSDNYIIVDEKKYSYNIHGYDEVEFFVSTNLGETPKPLVKVASGGEVSRIMLALKTSLAKNDSLPLLIFDEIDTGVSGRIGQKVGMALKKLSNYHQIIAITHLPQIAALAKVHYAVEKHQIENRVISNVRKLGELERLNEVAKLLSGEVVTETSISTAKELMAFAE